MIGAIRSATVSTFKWGVSLIGPVLVTDWAIRRFSVLQILNVTVPSATSGIIGLFSFALLRRLTGCGLKTALVASSVIPILNEIGRRKGPSSGGSYVLDSDDVLGNLSNLVRSRKSHSSNMHSIKKYHQNNEPDQLNPDYFRTKKIDSTKQLVSEDALNTFIGRVIPSCTNPTIRFRELSKFYKQQVWSNILDYMKRYVASDTSKKLPFVGYAGETLTLVKTSEDQFQLKATRGQSPIWSINLDADAILSDTLRTQRYIELLIAKYLFFDQVPNSSYSTFTTFIGFCERISKQLSLSMFNNVLAPHDLKFSFQTVLVSGYGFTNNNVIFTKQSLSDPSNSLTLTVQWPKSNNQRSSNFETYEVSIQRGLADGRKEYTLTLQDSQLLLTYNENPYDLTPTSNEDDKRDIFEMIQMKDELLHSPHTVVFHENSTIPYLTDGTFIPYERLKQIATYKNGAEGPSVLRVDGNRVLWWDEAVEEYSEPPQRFALDSPTDEDKSKEKFVLSDYGYNVISRKGSTLKGLTPKREDKSGSSSGSSESDSE